MSDKFYYNELDNSNRPNVKTYRTIASTCVKCGEKLDIATSIENAPPSPGDTSICIYCGNLMEFDEDMQLTELDLDKYVETVTDPQYRLVKNIVDKIHGSLK